jgi:hypothetical protein
MVARIIISITLVGLLVVNIWGQKIVNAQIAEIHRFPVGKEFIFDQDPSVVSGIGDMVMLDQDLTILGGNQAYYVYNSDGYLLGELPGGGPILDHFSSNRYLVLTASRGVTSAWVYNKLDFLMTKSSVPSPVSSISTNDSSLGLRSGIIVGDMLFCQNENSHALVSWEIGSKRDTVFRDDNATKKWFIEQGDNVGGDHYNAQSAGHMIGPAGSRGSKLDSPIMEQLNLDTGLSLGINSINWKNSMYVGTDRKGLVYCLTTIPWERESYIHGKGAQVCWEIIDLWQKKTVFRLMDPGEDNIQRNTVGPDGSIEYCNFEQDTKTFVLKRVSNDWWTELGLNNVKTAAVMDNRVRLRDKPGLQGQVNGYLYDSDVVRIRAQSDQEDVIDGVKARWYQVDDYDGRKGWVFGAFLDIGEK